MIANINVGVLGHVDSGKTALVRALSTHISTAALDKNPQSQARGITLDLGFSSFTVDAPERFEGAGVSKLQFTLVDCPGHASLIRTIIGGAQIIDIMLLVVDIVKGVQTQTAECLVVGEITTNNLIVVLNKIDLLPEASRDSAIEKATTRIRKVLASTKFAGANFVAVAAAPGGAGKGESSTGQFPATEKGFGGEVSSSSSNVAALVSHLVETVSLPVRHAEGPFVFSVDHCECCCMHAARLFLPLSSLRNDSTPATQLPPYQPNCPHRTSATPPLTHTGFQIKGQGTVLTGTVLSGAVGINDTIELPGLRLEKKVKSIQMFKRPVSRVQQGDRAGICVTGLDPELIERGIVCSPGSVPSQRLVLAAVKRVKYFREPLPSGCKLHCSIGHSTVMAEATFFGAKALLQWCPPGEEEGGGGTAVGGVGGSQVGPCSLTPTFKECWEWQDTLLFGAIGGAAPPPPQSSATALSRSAPPPHLLLWMAVCRSEF